MIHVRTLLERRRPVAPPDVLSLYYLVRLERDMAEHTYRQAVEEEVGVEGAGERAGYVFGRLQSYQFVLTAMESRWPRLPEIITH